MIKVVVRSAQQAIEVINSFKNTDDLKVVIKENTATENSDVLVKLDKNKLTKLINHVLLETK